MPEGDGRFRVVRSGRVSAARFAVVGGGFRAQYFLRLARALPGELRASGVVVRDPDRAEALRDRWNVPVHPNLADLLAAGRPDFVVVCVSRGQALPVLHEVAAAGLPVLTETPPAEDLAGLHEVWALVRGGARLQVAEQYRLQPMNAARLALARSGLLGEVQHAQVSLAHDYHGMSLLRAFLDTGFRMPRVTARRFAAPLVAGPDRQGPPREYRVTQSTQVIAQLDFGDRLGIHDFANEQYRSWIRGPRVLVRGDRGELDGVEARWITDFATPVQLRLRRMDAGQDTNPEPYSHRGVLAGERWLFRNPFPGVTLSDDEIAGATMLRAMADYAGGGAGPYDAAEGLQDAYLALLIAEAAARGEAVSGEAQPWCT
ncbi:Gfo/Idh/MocA family protein [Roseomonas elaeocarpi]|uniref:Gfo/Idh/MocA family protein n=1 Tax=Roseomonas elaeocarpi TaxID=907779 RepID=A0ABV6JRI4_9PROT